ncbi:MAG: fibronectin type III domain-containing protein [Paludibacter sp.]|nr:fibronectin type III domain-containing protein [Paludibacter sp.]
MKKILLLLILVYLSINSIYSATRRFRASYRTDPSTTISIIWDQYSGTSPVLYYGTVDNGTNWSLYPSQSSPVLSTTDGGMKNTFVRLSGLTPNTIYYFVIKDSEGTSQRYSFQTISNDPNQPLSFICGADTRSGIAVRVTGFKLVAKLRPQAVIFDGDLTDSGTAAELQSWFDDWTNTIATDGRITPIVVAEGNHETGVVNISNLYDTPNDGNIENNYHSLPFGGNLLRVYSLNSNMSNLTAQTAWLQGQLMSYGKSTTWNLPQYHLPIRPISSAKNNNQDEYNQWVPLFEQYNVKLVQEADAHLFSITWPIKSSTSTGNDQGFVRDDLNGIIYFGMGGWGAPLYAADTPKSWTRGYESINNFMVVHFYLDKVDIYTVRLENEPNVPALTDQTRMTIPSQLSIERMTDRNGIQSGDHATISKTITVLHDNPESSVTIFPTVVQNILTIRDNNPTQGTNVRVVNITGKTMDDINMNSSGLLKLNVSNYQSGTYIVQVSNDTNLKVYKIIKL